MIGKRYVYNIQTDLLKNSGLTSYKLGDVGQILYFFEIEFFIIPT